MSGINDEQPPPISSAARPTWDLAVEDIEALRRSYPPPAVDHKILGLVIEDAKSRDLMGRKQYGTPLTPLNGRDNLVDGYQEALDLAVYLRNEIAEKEELSQSKHNYLRLLYGDALQMARKLRALIAERGLK